MQVRRRQNNRVTIAIQAGNGQSAATGTAVAIAPQVKVTRVVGGANVQGARVLFIAGGDSKVSGASSQTTIATTDASGLASTPWTMGASAVDYSLQASALTAAGAGVTFTATATGAAAAQIVANSVVDQSATVLTTVAAPPSVLVTDAGGNPISGTSVTFAVTAGGGSIVGGAANTNASGVATCTSWTLGAVAGINTATATSAGLTGSPVTFNANGTAVLPVSIAIQSGGSQSGIVAGSASAAYTFRVKDGSLAGVPGVTVAFTRTVGTGAPSVASAVTDVNGDVSCTYTTGVLVGVNTFTASFVDNSGATISATETTTSVVGTKAILTITVEPPSNSNSGAALPGSMVVQIQDANGNLTTSTDSVVITKQSGSGTLSGTTNVAAVAGVATFSNLILTGSGAHTLLASSGGLTTDTSATITVAPPVPAALGIGTSPSTTTVAVVISPFPTCLIQDGNGQTVTSATNAVTVSLGDNGEGATLGGTLTVSAVAGIATFNDLTVSVAGSYTLVYTSSSLVGVTSAAFTVAALSSAWPNEPNGLTTIFEHACDLQLATTAGTSGSNTGIYKRESTYAANNAISVVASTVGLAAPYGDNNLWRFRYPSGQGAGTGATNWRAWTGTIGTSRSPVDTLYLSFWFNAYGDGTNWDNTVQIMKPFGFLGYGAANTSASNEGYWTFDSQLGVVTTMSLSFKQQSAVSRAVPGGVSIAVNTWYQLEFLATANTNILAGGVGATSNGTLQMWLYNPATGIRNRFCNRTDMAWKTTGNTNGFNLIKWNNTYGGTGTTKTRNDDIYVAHIRCSGS